MDARGMLKAAQGSGASLRLVGLGEAMEEGRQAINEHGGQPH